VPRYLIEHRLGEGSFGVVWLARREEGHGLVAIKVPRQGRMLEFPALREAFEREIEAALRAPRHANVLLAHESTEALLSDGSTVPALVTEYVAGARSLLEAADERQLDLKGRLELFMGAARGVAELQKYGSIHTDLKPQNILVGLDQVPRVADFGGLRLLADNDTAPAQISYRYAAPEVFDNRPETLDHRTVVYSLGKMLLELLAGSDAVTLPFYRNRQEAAALVRKWRPPDCREVLGAGWAGVLREIDRATDADRSVRQPNADALVDALQRASVSLWRRAWRQLVELADEVPTPLRAVCCAVLLVLLATAGSVVAGQLLAWNGQLGPDRHPKVVLPLPPDDGLQHVAVVSISSAAEALAFANAHEITGITENRATWRRVWAHVAAELAHCQPRALVFDILFRRNDAATEQTERLASEIRRLNEEEGIPSVIAISPTWDPSPGETLLDARLAAAAAPQRAGAAEFDPGDCGQPFTVILSLVPSEPVESASSLSLAAVAAALSDRTPSTPVAARGCEVHLDARNGMIELRGPRRGGRVRVDRCQTLKDLDSSSRAGARRQAESLPERWSRDEVVAAVRYFAWPDLDEMAANTHSIEDAVRLATTDPGRLRDRVILFINTAPTSSGASDMVSCGDRTIPNAWFHAQAIESMLDEVASDGRSASRLPIGGARHVAALLALSAAGVVAGIGAVRIARRLRWRSAPVDAAWRQAPRWFRHSGLLAALLLAITALVALVTSAWLHLVVPLHLAEFVMTSVAAFASGTIWTLWPRAGRRAARREQVAMGPFSTMVLPLALLGPLLGPDLASKPARAAATDIAPAAAVAPADQAGGGGVASGSGSGSGVGTGAVTAPARLGNSTSDDSPVEASLSALSGNFPQRRFVRQWYDMGDSGGLPIRRQTNYAVKSGKAERNASTGLLELTPDASSGAAQAYFTTSLGSAFQPAPLGETLVKRLALGSGAYTAWWFPWVGQGPVQGASEGTQIAVASRSGSPTPEDPAGATIELIRFYLVGPNAGSRLQLFNTSESPAKALLPEKGMVGAGFTDLVVEVRVVRVGSETRQVSAGAGPKAVTAAGTPEEFAELAALKAFAISNGLRVPE